MNLKINIMLTILLVISVIGNMFLHSEKVSNEEIIEKKDKEIESLKKEIKSLTHLLKI